MLNLRTCAAASGCWMVITFTICVVGGVAAPGLPIPHRTLEQLLPGFTWISVGSFVLGVVETFLFGVYAAWLFVSLHNFFVRRWNTADTTSATKAA